MKVHSITTSEEYLDEKAGVWRIMDVVPNVGDQIGSQFLNRKNLKEKRRF